MFQAIFCPSSGA